MASSCVVWDCDGVVFNSNYAKIDAFNVMLHRTCDSAEDADTKVAFIKNNPHKTRYQLFAEWFPDCVDERVKELSDECENMYHKLDPVPDVINAASSYTSAIVSNSSQDQLRRIFAHHGITTTFSAGIFGSPTSKYEHVKILGPDRVMAFVGDGKLDWEVARHYGIPFVFVPMFSAWKEGLQVCESCPGSVVCSSWKSLSQILFTLEINFHMQQLRKSKSQHEFCQV